MRKLILLLLVIAMTAGCKGKGGWTSTQRTEFVSTCVKSASGAIGDEKAKSYCNCLLPKIEAKYSKYDDANKASADMTTSNEIMTMAKDCIK